jgi:1-acyl-sn-glycerol-3-phosphate acyltransferase
MAETENVAKAGQQETAAPVKQRKTRAKKSSKNSTGSASKYRSRAAVSAPQNAAQTPPVEVQEKASADAVKTEPAAAACAPETPKPAPEQPKAEQMVDEHAAPGEGIVAEVLDAIGGFGEELIETAGKMRKFSLTKVAGNLFSAAQDLLTLDYYSRKLGEFGLKDRSTDVDEFGFDVKYWEKMRPFYEFLFYKYWRVALKGIQNVPAKGKAILVPNHAGAFTFDGVMLKIAMLNEHRAKRDVRFLVEDFLYYLPFTGAFSNRIGGVRACQENAERLLKHGNVIATFPEGIQGVGKLYHDRYKLQRFGRGGVIKLAIRTKSPIVPVAIIGNEEIYPMLWKVERFADALGVPYIPITPTFPLLGPIGFIPAPVKWMIHFGRPIDYSKYSPEDAEDTILVNRLTENLRTTIQTMVNELLETRKSVFRG